MLTNVTVYDERIYSLLDEYFGDNYQVGVSSDDFHDKSIKRIYNNLKNKSNNPSLAPRNVDEIIENMRKHLLHEKSLGFIGVSNFLIKNGRAGTLDVPKKQYEVMGYFYSDFKEKLFVGPVIFIGADGYVTDGNSDISKRKEQPIGNILDSSLEKVIKNGGIKIEISSIEEFYEKMLKREEEFHTLQGDHLTFENNKIIYMDYQTDLKFEKEIEKIDKIIKDLVSLQLDNKPIGEYLNLLDFSDYPYDLSQMEHEKVYKL